MLVRPGGHRLNRIHTLLTPVDGSPGAALATAVVVTLCRATKARSVLLEAVVPMAAYALGSTYESGFMVTDPAWDADVSKRAKQYVTGLAVRLREAGIDVEGRVAETAIASPSKAIADSIGVEADQIGADMIVMSTHALTGPARTLLGSVADEVVRGAHRPVMLVRRGMRIPSMRTASRATLHDGASQSSTPASLRSDERHQRKLNERADLAL